MSREGHAPDARSVPKSLLWFLGIPAVVAPVFLVVILIGGTTRFLTGYSTQSPMTMTTTLVAGGGLVLVGAISIFRRPQAPLGLLVAALASAWLATEAVGWVGQVIVQLLAFLIGPLLLAFVAHLGLSFPRDRVVGRSNRIWVSIIYAASLSFSMGRLLTYDPFLDTDCWRTCVHIDLVPFPNMGVAQDLQVTWLWMSVVGGAFVAALIVRRIMSTSTATRMSGWPVLVPLAAISIVEAAHAALMIYDEATEPESNYSIALFLSSGLLLTVVWLAAGWGLVRLWRASAGLTNLARELELAPRPGTFKDYLARSLRDNSLEVAFRLPESDVYVDSSGNEVEVSPSPDREVATIERAGEVLGVIVHSSDLPTPDLEREIGSAARLAIDNERLRAGLLARIAQLRGSQVQIVEIADAARSQIERDLHDGAQQSILAVALEVRMAIAAARESGDEETAARLDAALEEVHHALEDLRELAHGIFPAILADGGLRAAIPALAEGSACPIDVEIEVRRQPAAIEMAAYLVALAAVEVAERDNMIVSILAHEDEGALVIEVHADHGDFRPADFVHVGDRVGASGGSLSVEGGQIRSVIPCVS